ncbi:MAG: sodium-independent anion transporter, partial [Lachnospiraceae bacterium]|nr:sodium-independent anion transporter [Lachnospiraceae bacterium]
MNKVAFQPLIVSALKGYNAKQFQKDLLAGIIVAIIALPLSIAFAMGAGFTPEKGIWAAIIATLIGSLIGGSRVQISGPTGAFIVITQSVVLQYGKDGLVVAMLLAGVMLILAGVFHLGKYIKFIPAPITTGFTAGIAVSIFTLEVKDFLGLNPESMPVKFIGKWKYYLTSLDETNYYAVILGVIAMVVMLVWPKINRTIPNSFVAIVVGTVLARVFQWDVITLGEMAKSIGTPSVPSMDLQTVMDLVSPAFTIAVLIAMQALLSAVVTDGLINSRSNANHELIA